VPAICLAEALEARFLLATDIHVDANSPAPLPDGSSWEIAYADLQQALTAAVSGDRILVADGTYKPTTTTDRTISLQLKTGVAVLGGYAGYAAHDPDARHFDAYKSILSGDIGKPADNRDNSYHVVLASGVDSTAILDGFTITGGNANGADDLQKRGAAMHNSSSSPTLTNCILWNDTALSGSELYNSEGSAPAVTHSDVQAGWEGEGNINAGPLFVRNPSPGADGKWRTADDDYEDLHLQTTSPCIDAGGNAAVPPTVSSDLDGHPRIADYPGAHDPGPIVDMDAYERQPPVTISGTDGNDTFYARLSTDHSILHIWAGAAPVGNPLYSYPLLLLASCMIDTSLGDDALILDFSNGAPLLAFIAGDGIDSLVLTGTHDYDGLAIEPARILYEDTRLAGLRPPSPINCDSVESTALDSAAPTIPLAYLNLAEKTRAQVLPGSRVLRLAGLLVKKTAALDLADNDMILANGDIAAISDAIKSPRLIGKPANYTGLAAILNDQGDKQRTPIKTTFAGQTVSNTDLLIKYTWQGDANLDGVVNADDYSLIDTAFITQEMGYYHGDFNYDNVINADDYFLIDNAFLA